MVGKVRNLKLFDTKRGVILAVVLYLTSLIIGLVTALIFEPYLVGIENQYLNWSIGVILSVVLAIPFTRWYFDGDKVIASYKEGVKLGTTYLVVGLCADFILAIPLFLNQGFGLFFSFYLNIYYLTFVLAMLFTTSFIGSVMEK